jgi:hypothetical protein
MPTRFYDAIITYRILKKLVQPFEDTDAYKLGIIDRKGTVLKKENQLKTSQERDAYTILDRLVFRLKRIINKVPVENKRLLNIAAALTLVREHAYDTREYLELERDFVNTTPDAQTINEVSNFMASKQIKSFGMFLEDGGAPVGITNSVGAGFMNQANPDGNANLRGPDTIMGKMARRKKPQLVGMKIKR